MKKYTWEKFDKQFGSQTRVGKIAQGATNLAGGKGITDYFGGKGSKLGLASGVAQVAAAVSTGGAGLLRGAGKKAFTKVASKAPKAKKAVRTYLDDKFDIQDRQIMKEHLAKKKK